MNFYVGGYIIRKCTWYAHTLLCVERGRVCATIFSNPLTLSSSVWTVAYSSYLDVGGLS